MVICYVLGCKSRSERKCENITFHSFPKDCTIRQLWIRATGRENWDPNKYARVCSKHFEEKCFKKTPCNIYLESFSVPTLHIVTKQLPNDMENYMEYHVMGSVSKIRMKPGCKPTKFECQRGSSIKRKIISTKRPLKQTKKKKALIEKRKKACEKESEENCFDDKETESARSDSSSTTLEDMDDAKNSKYRKLRKLREKWIAAIRRVNFQPSEYSKVCKKHFKKDDYRLPKDSMQKYPAHVLKKDAVPSKFSWNEKNNTLLDEINTDKKIFLNRRCSVLQCKSGSTKNIILHSCPNQEAIRKKWAEIFKVNKDVVKNMLICSQHFLKTDYLSSKDGDCRTLKETAVPSQKLPRSTRIISIAKKVPRTKKEFLQIKSSKRAAKMTETEVVDEVPRVEQEEEVRDCRACLKTLDSKTSVCNIFQSWVPPWTGMEPTIALELAKLANVEVLESDHYSKIICGACYNKLLDAAMFAASVRSCDTLLRKKFLPEINTEEKVWPKPIQVDKNINENILQEMDVDIKQEIVSDEEYEPVSMENAYSTDNYVKPEIDNLEIKVEPEEILGPPFEEPPPLTITINGTMSLNPSVTENKTLLNGTDEYEAIITERMENTALCNGTEEYHEEQHLDVAVKEEPQSEDEDLEQVPDLSLECLLCTKSFNSVTGLKAHVIAQHSYKSVKRKSGSAESPQKRQKDEYQCQICRRTFTTSTDLMVHETCHNKHSCYGCSRKFDSFKQLSKHRKRCKVPLSKTANKPRTLDDVLRPAKKEKMVSKLTGNVKNDLNDSRRSSVNLQLNTTTRRTRSYSSKSENEVSNVDSEDMQSKGTVKSDCT